VFIDVVLAKSAELIEKSNLTWEKSHTNLQEFTNDEYQAYMGDNGAYFNELKEKYLTQKYVDFARKVLEIAKGNNQFKKDDEGTETTEATVPDKKTVKESTAVADEDLLDFDNLMI
jgi:hypothetical protein